MKVLYHPKQAGKTTRMIEWLRENSNNILITFSQDEENRLRELCPDLEERIFCWEKYQQAFTRRGVNKATISIDNADMILQRLCVDVIENVTFTDFENAPDVVE